MGLDTVELVMAVEEEFGLEIPDAAAEKMLAIWEVHAFLAGNFGVLGGPVATRQSLSECGRSSSESWRESGRSGAVCAVCEGFARGLWVSCLTSSYDWFSDCRA